MNEYLYEITCDLEDVDYNEIIKKHKRVSSEGEEDYEVICM